MGYRLTLSEKWDDKWFRSMGPLRKLTFLFMCDKCDLAGFYEIDIEDMAFRIKAGEDQIKGAIEGLERGLLAPNGIKDGEVVWLRNFLEHQKNTPLNPKSNIHEKIMECFRKRGKLGEEALKNIRVLEGASKGLSSPRGIGKGNSKGNKGGSGGKKLMKNSGVTLEDIQDMFNRTDDMKNADAKHYFNTVMDWSTANGKVGLDWEASVRNWARKDLQEGKLKFSQRSGLKPGIR